MANIWFVVDMVGRSIVGDVISDADGVMTMQDPIIMQETVDSRQKTVGLGFGPIMHTFDITTLEVKWAERTKVDADLAEKYSQFMTRIKAARQGIEIAGSMKEATDRPRIHLT